MSKLKVIIVGGGPAGMMAAWQLAGDFDVHLFEKEKMPGQKFLVAGKGGLNLSKSLPANSMMERYLPQGVMDSILQHFGPEDLRKWFENIGIETFTGSSGKIFPAKGTSPAGVLRAILNSLQSRGVKVHLNTRLISFSREMQFGFENEGNRFEMSADFAVLALGGASWAVTGSDGKWTEMFSNNGVNTLEFQPSNCGVNILWPENIRNYHEGKPLKNIRISAGNLLAKGEVLITEYGLEGSALYAVIPAVRQMVNLNQSAYISLDFKPLIEEDVLTAKAEKLLPGTRKYAETFKLDAIQMALIKSYTNKETFQDPYSFAKAIKMLKIPVVSLRPIEEAISSVGGLPLDELNADWSLKTFSEIFIAGEMADWDAPTGGYLLQGCFSSGAYVADQIKKSAIKRT
jgi:uncharacterized flavoprotein (TIGR03862 family)